MLYRGAEAVFQHVRTKVFFQLLDIGENTLLPCEPHSETPDANKFDISLFWPTI